MRLGSIGLLVTLFVGVLVSSTFADWITDPGSSGLLVRNGGSPRAVISDGAGGALIGFGTYFGSNTIGDIVVQKLDAQGLLPWGANGVTLGLVGALVGDYGPWMAGDGAGGAIAIWRGPSQSVLNGQRVSASGALQWTPSAIGDGVHLASAPTGILPVWVGQDGAGSLIAVWFQGSPSTLFAQRFDINGAAFWGSQGLSLGIATSSMPGIVSDDAGGIFVFWSAVNAQGSRDVFGQRFGRDGVPLWIPGGVPICSVFGDQGNGQPGLVAVGDGGGGAIVAWLDQRVESAGDVYAQRVNGSGLIQWVADGLPLCNSIGSQSVLAAVPDGAGGMVAAWQDGRDAGTAPDLYAQRVAGNGILQWQPNGVGLCIEAGAQFEDPVVPGPSVCLAPDGSGGAFAAWTDSRPDASPGNDTFAQHLDGSGTATWPLTGLRFGAASATLGRPAIMPDGAGGCAVLWGAGFELRARGSSGAATGVGDGFDSFQLALRGAFPNPSSGRFSIAFSLPDDRPARIEVMDVTGRRVWTREVEGGGLHTESVRALRPGIYFVCLRRDKDVATTRAVVID